MMSNGDISSSWWPMLRGFAESISLSGTGHLHLAAPLVGIGVATTAPAVAVGGNPGALLTWSGGEFSYQGFYDSIAIQVGGTSLSGKASLTGVTFNWPAQSNQAKSAPVIQGLAGSRLDIANTTISDYGTGGGTFVSIPSSGTGYNKLIGNTGPGWAYSVGGAAPMNSITPTADGSVYAGNN